jgi:hypothetical protein
MSRRSSMPAAMPSSRSPRSSSAQTRRISSQPRAVGIDGHWSQPRTVGFDRLVSDRDSEVERVCFAQSPRIGRRPFWDPRPTNGGWGQGVRLPTLRSPVEAILPFGVLCAATRGPLPGDIVAVCYSSVHEPHLIHCGRIATPAVIAPWNSHFLPPAARAKVKVVIRGFTPGNWEEQVVGISEIFPYNAAANGSSLLTKEEKISIEDGEMAREYYLANRNSSVEKLHPVIFKDQPYWKCGCFSLGYTH